MPEIDTDASSKQLQASERAMQFESRMTSKSRFSQSDITRLLKAAKLSGYASAKVTVLLDGTLELAVSEKPIDGSINEWTDLE